MSWEDGFGPLDHGYHGDDDTCYAEEGRMGSENEFDHDQSDYYGLEDYETEEAKEWDSPDCGEHARARDKLDTFRHDEVTIPTYTTVPANQCKVAYFIGLHELPMEPFPSDFLLELQESTFEQGPEPIRGAFREDLNVKVLVTLMDEFIQTIIDWHDLHSSLVTNIIEPPFRQLNLAEHSDQDARQQQHRTPENKQYAALKSRKLRASIGLRLIERYCGWLSIQHEERLQRAKAFLEPKKIAPDCSNFSRYKSQPFDEFKRAYFADIETREGTQLISLAWQRQSLPEMKEGSKIHRLVEESRRRTQKELFAYENDYRDLMAKLRFRYNLLARYAEGIEPNLSISELQDAEAHEAGEDIWPEHLID